jgi:MazG family protein
VFEDATLRDEFERSGVWERVKAAEKEGRPASGRQSLLDDVPLALPALSRAVKLQARAARVGFDWPSLAPVLAKLEEEIGELKGAIAEKERDPSRGASEKIKEEFGDLLFVLANVARHLGIDPEAALRDANSKFVRRFVYIEDALRAEGRSPAQSSLEEMDRLWDEAKASELAEK